MNNKIYYKVIKDYKPHGERSVIQEKNSGIPGDQSPDSYPLDEKSEDSVSQGRTESFLYQRRNYGLGQVPLKQGDRPRSSNSKDGLTLSFGEE